MSETIDQKVVEMKFDNSNFETNVKESMSTLDQLKKSLDLEGSAKGFENISKAAKDVSFDGLNQGIEDVKVHFSALETIATTALATITSKAVDAGLAMAKSLSTDLISEGFSQYEKKNQSVQTIMNATGKDIETVDAALEKLIWYADETSYSFSDMVDNVGKFTAVGVDLDTAANAMMGISNWAAVSGQNAQTASRAMYNLSQAMGLGYVSLVDWKSIELANMATSEFKQNVIDTAVSLGKINPGDVTVQNFRNSLSDKATKGWFDNDVLLAVLSKYGNYANLVYDQVQESGELCADAMNTVAEQMAGDYELIGEKAFRAAQEAKTFTEAIDATKDAVKSKWATLFENIFGNYDEARVTFTNLANSLWEVFAGPVDNFNELFSEALESPSISSAEWSKFRETLKNDLGLSATEVYAFQDAVTEAAKAQGIDVDAMIEKWGTFGQSLKEGWLTSDLLNDIIEGTTVSTEDALTTIQDLVDTIWRGDLGNGEERFKQLEEMGYTWQEIQAIVDKGYGYQVTLDDLTEGILNVVGATVQESEALQKVKEAIDSGDFDYYNELVSRMSGRELRNAAWDNLFNSETGVIVTYVSAIREAFSSVFGDLDSGAIRSVLEWFYNFTNKLLDEDRVASFKTTLENVFHIINSGLQILKGAFSVVKAAYDNTIGPIVSGVWTIVKSIARGIGNLAKQFDENLESFTGFATAVDWLNEKLAPFKEAVKVVSDEIANFITALFNGEDFSSAFVNAVSNIIKSLDPEHAKEKIKKFKDLFEGLKETFSKFGETFKTVGETISRAWESFQNTELGQKISGVVESIKSALSDAWEAIKTWFTNLFGGDGLGSDFDLFGGIQSALDSFNEWMKNIDFETGMTNISDAILGLKDRIKNAFTSVKEYLEQNELFNSVVTTIKEKFGELKDALSSGGDDSEEEKEPFATRVLQKLKDIIQWFKDNMPSLEEVYTGIKTLAESSVFIAFAGLITKIRMLFSGGTGFIKNINKVLSGLGNALNSFAFSQIGKGILYISGAILALAAALTVLTLLDAGKLQNAALMLAAVAAGFGVLAVGIGQLMTAIGIKNKNNASARLLNSTANVFDSLKTGLTGIMTSISSFVNNIGAALSTAIKITSYASFVIALAAALAVLAVAVYELSKIDTDRLIAGLATVIALIGSLALALKLLTAGTYSEFSFGIGKGGLSLNSSSLGTAASGFAFIGMAVAVLVFVQVLNQIRDYDLEDILKGVITIGSILMELALAIRLAGGEFKISTGLGSIAMAGAVYLFVKEIDQIRQYSLSDILKGVITIGSILLELSLVSALSVGMNISRGAGMFLVAEAVNVLVTALKGISKLNTSQILKGVAAITALMTALGVGGILFAAANRINGISTALAGLGVILIGVAANIWAISNAISKGVDFDDIASSIGKVASSLVEGLIDAIVNSAEAIVSGFVSLLGVLVEYTPQIASLLVDFFIGLINTLTLRMPELSEAIANFCGALIDNFGESFKNVDVTHLKEAIEGLLIATGALALIGKFGSFTAILKGLADFALVLVAVGAIMTGLGALSNWLGEDWITTMEKGAQVLTILGTGIGNFLGGLFGGLLGGSVYAFTSSLPGIATNLCNFLTNIQPFLTGCSQIDENFSDSITRLTTGMLQIIGGSFLDTLNDAYGKLITGDKDYDSIKDYIDDFTNIADGLVAFNEKIKDVSWASMDKATSAASIITALADAIPARAGLIEGWVGIKNFSEAGIDFFNLGLGLKYFCTAIGTDATFDAAHAAQAAAVLKVLIESYPETGGEIQLFEGWKNLSRANIDFASLGIGVSAFCKAIGENATFDVENATKAAGVINTLIENYPETGGGWQNITGWKNLAEASTYFASLGVGVSAFSKSIGENATFDVESAKQAAEVLKTLIDAYPKTGGGWQNITGWKDLASAAQNFASLGSGLASFATSLQTAGGVNSGDVANAGYAIKILNYIINMTPPTGGYLQMWMGETNLDQMAKNIESLGTAMNSFVSSMSGMSESELSGAKGVASKIIEIMDMEWPSTDSGLMGWLLNGLYGGTTNFDDLKSDIESVGEMAQILCTSFGGDNASSIEAAKAGAKGIIDILKMEWPSTETGLVGWFINLYYGGGTSFDDLVTAVGKIGGMIKAFAGAMDGVDAKNVDVGRMCAKAIVDVLNNIPTDITDVTDFTDAIWDLGWALYEFASDMEGISYTSVTFAAMAISALLTVINNMADVDFDSVTGFSDALGNLADSGIEDFISAFEDAETTVATTITTFISNVVQALDVPTDFYNTASDDASNFNDGFTLWHDTITINASILLTDVVTNLTDSSSFYTAGSTDAEGYKDGIAYWQTTTENLASTIANNSASNMSLYWTFWTNGSYNIQGFTAGLEAQRTAAENEAYYIAGTSADQMDRYWAFYTSGTYCMQGFIAGMDSYSNLVYNAAYDLGSVAVSGANAGVGAASPAKEFIKTGMYSDMGFAKGLLDYAYLVDDATTEMAEGSVSTMKNALYGLNFDNLDDSPTIRPVLDLSDIQNGASRIEDLLYAEGMYNVGDLSAGGVARIINQLRGVDVNSIYDDSEVIAVINDLGNKVDNLNSAINNIKLYLNGKELVGGVITDIDDALGVLSTKKKRGIV